MPISTGAAARARGTARPAVGLGHPRVTRVEVHVHVVDFLLRRHQAVEGLVSLDVLERDHVDRADQLADPVVGQERAGRQRGRFDVERAEPREEIREGDEAADLLVVAARGRGHLGLGGNGLAERNQAGHPGAPAEAGA